MVSIRDDFVIAIRSAFLKKGTKQKFSLLSLIILSISVIILSSLDFKIIRYAKIGINEVVYRAAYIATIPENLFKKGLIKTNDHLSHYGKFKLLENELEELRSKDLSKKIIKFENQELKKLINDYLDSENKILAKVFIDKDSPFLKSIIINKGSKNDIKLGLSVFDKSYLVGKVIEVNYSSSRVLLLSDLNSKVPVTLEPGNIQAIMSGSGKNHGVIKYLKNDNLNLIDEGAVYTSGAGGVYKSGIPVGKFKISNEQSDIINKAEIKLYSDPSQLKHVLVELPEMTSQELVSQENMEINKVSLNEVDANKEKLELLLEEKEVLNTLKSKLENENLVLKEKLINLENEILSNEKIINQQKDSLKQKKIDEKELEFLKLNLIYSDKCKKRAFNRLFEVGTPEYKKCILNKGKIN